MPSASGSSRVEAARRLRELFGETELVARLGGDEIVVLQRQLDRPEDAARLAERLREALARPLSIDGSTIGATVSTGIAVAPDDGRDFDELLRNAGLARDTAKAQGGDCTRFFEADLDRKVRKRRGLEHDLRNAFAAEEFTLYYQPQYDLVSRRLNGFEALVRWRHPRRGIVSPAEFIPVAEETGLIVPLGEWVLRRACRDAMSWPAALGVAVNLSAAQFRQESLVAVVEDALHSSGLPPARLELEITESVVMEECGEVIETLERLQELGVGIAMDDFGTGFSSLNTLWRFPFGKLKIDRAFVMNLTEDRKIPEIVATIVTLAKSLQLTVTAEGVETYEQADMLQRFGCHQVQGFFFGRPEPAEAVLRRLEAAEPGPSRSRARRREPFRAPRTAAA